MFWKNQPKPLPGDVRYKVKFAWLPTETISGITVWLEKVAVFYIWDTPWLGRWEWRKAYSAKADYVLNEVTFAARLRKVWHYEDREFRLYRGTSWTHHDVITK